LAPSYQPLGRRKARIGCDGAVEQQQGLCIRSFSQFNERCNGSHIEIARGEIGGCFGLCSPDFRISHLGLNRSCDVGSDLVLKIKDFLKLAVISFGPDVAAGVGVDQAGRNCAVADPRSCASLVLDMRCIAMSGMRHYAMFGCTLSKETFLRPLKLN
jgi:hypothetical protein